MMKHGWYQKINNAVCYCQRPFNVAVLIEQISNYNNALREQANMEKYACVIQINKSSEEKTCKSRISTTAKEHEPCASYYDNLNNESKHMNEDQ